MSRHHPRIHPANYPILDKYDKEHPAVRALQLHAEARDECVGKEIQWAALNNQSLDQIWFSRVDQRNWSFSSFAYAFISFDLVLYGWLTQKASELQPFEEDFLHELPRLLTLMDECESEAIADSNDAILPLISKTRAFFDAYEKAIILRTGAVSIKPDRRYVESLWGAGRCER